LLPHIRKLEKLLRHNLSFSADILDAQVDDAVNRAINEQGINVPKLSPDDVDWDKIILDSVYRTPPFEDGKYEKGFRDAVIAETFYQLVEKSPTTPASCRLAFVAEDKSRAGQQITIGEAKRGSEE